MIGLPLFRAPLSETSTVGQGRQKKPNAGEENRCPGSALQRSAVFCATMLLCVWSAKAQTNVVTQHYDIARTGANTNETILTPANVNTNSFGKLFSYSVDGYVYAQPLYMAGVTMGVGTPQAGTNHDVIFIATEHDSVYALDADNNSGANANPLWHITLLDTAHGVPPGVTATTVPNGDLSTSDIVLEIGITSTPVIDPLTNTIYVVGKTKELANPKGPYIQRLHALDITTGAEKFGGPMILQASVPGNGNGSSGGTVTWDPKWQNNRASLLLLNGIVYIGFGSHGDNGTWHGWILAYNATTLTQTGAWCSSPNGIGGGIWMAGSGFAADVPDPTGHPYGRMFTTTGNGNFDATAPNYTNAMDYGDSIIKLDLSNGAPTMNTSSTVVGDAFTPHDQAYLNNADLDQASGGVLLLPDSVSGGQHLLTQVGKTGRVYVLNQDNLGGYNPNNTTDPGEKAHVGGMWSMPAYWNGNLYFWANQDNLKAYSFSNGVISANPTSTSSENSYFPGSTPTVSANGTTNGIVWDIRSDAYESQGREILYAHDATNVTTTFYSSEQNVSRDNPGNAVKMTVPTVIFGRVYVGAEYQVSVYGLLNGATQAATPAISPATESFNTSLQVTITDSTTGTTIYYTTDGSTPTTASTVYSGPFTVTTTETVEAIAAGTESLQSPVASVTYTLLTQTATPTFSPAPGDYISAQPVTISDSTSGATIYYTLDGSTPTTSSAIYTGPVSITASATLKAIATANGLTVSAVASGAYTINQNGVSSISFGSGFAAGGMTLNGSAKLNGATLRLTDGGQSEAASAWYSVEANIQTFTTDFSFQVTPASASTADGFTFTIQGNNTTALGPSGGGLAYGPVSTSGTGGIPNSVAVKFDLYSNAGEGVDSTGIYQNGQPPTVPAVDMTSSGVNLHSGDVFNVHMTYDGTNLTMTITDATTLASFSHTWAVDIPNAVGGPVAYLGFTGGTGYQTATQQVLNWTYVFNGVPGQQVSTPTFSLAGGVYLGTQTVSISDATSGAVVFYTLDGSTPGPIAGGSTQQYNGPITVSATETINAIATASGLAQSSVASVTYTIESQVAVPTFTPMSGTYPSAQQVTISAVSGAAIYYTTNGNVPSPGTSGTTHYTGPVAVSATTTINAIATESGFFNSNVANATYTITSTGVGSIQYVQSNYADPQTSNSSLGIPYTLAQAGGDLNVVVVGWADSTSTVSSVTDSMGNSYSLAVGPTVQPGYETQSIYYAKNIAAAAANGNIVTVTFSAAAAYPDIRILEYSGADPNSPLDVVAAGTGTNSPTNSGTATTTNASDLLFGASTVWTSNIGAGAGFTARILTQPNHDLVEDEMVVTTGSYSATAPLNNPGPWIMQLVAFKAHH